MVDFEEPWHGRNQSSGGLFFSEVDLHHGAARFLFARLFSARFWLWLCDLRIPSRQLHFILECELHRRIGERGHRRVGHLEQRRDAPKTKANLEALFVDFQISELILQNDGHLLGVLNLKVGWNIHALATGPKLDEEVMLSRQAFLDNSAKYPWNHTAKRFNGDFSIRDERFAVGHAPL